MITRIKGNTLSVSVDLEKVEIFENGKKVTDYFPKSDDNVAVRLKGVDVHTFEDIKVIGKTLKWVIDGDLLSCGTYGLEVAIVTADGVKLRSFKENQLKIVNSNEEAGIDSPAEFEADNVYLGTAKFAPVIELGSGGAYDDTEIRKLIAALYKQIAGLPAWANELEDGKTYTPSEITALGGNAEELKKLLDDSTFVYLSENGNNVLSVAKIKAEESGCTTYSISGLLYLINQFRGFYRSFAMYDDGRIGIVNRSKAFLTDKDLEGKVDKEEGKGLSTNDFTQEEKDKLGELKNHITELPEWVNHLESGKVYTSSEIEALGGSIEDLKKLLDKGGFYASDFGGGDAKTLFNTAVIKSEMSGETYYSIMGNSYGYGIYQLLFMFKGDTIKLQIDVYYMALQSQLAEKADKATSQMSYKANSISEMNAIENPKEGDVCQCMASVKTDLSTVKVGETIDEIISLGSWQDIKKYMDAMAADNPETSSFLYILGNGAISYEYTAPSIILGNKTLRESDFGTNAETEAISTFNGTSKDERTVYDIGAFLYDNSVIVENSPIVVEVQRKTNYVYHNGAWTPQVDVTPKNEIKAIIADYIDGKILGGKW